MTSPTASGDAAPSTVIRKIVVFHDEENVSFQPLATTAGHIAYESILRSALACIIGEADAAQCDLTTLSVRYWFVYCPEKRVPPKYVLDAFETLGVTKATVGTKAGAVDKHLKEEMRRSIRSFEEDKRSSADSAASMNEILFVLLTADSDFATEIREARQAGIPMVAIHGGNAKAAYDSLLRHVRTDWERIRAGEWRAAKPRLTLKGGQLESADGRLARTPDLRICLTSVNDTDAGLVLEAQTPADSNAVVHVRITFDNWSSQTDHRADRVQCKAGFDTHRATISVPPATSSAKFCIHANSVAEGEKWDNNEGKDYLLIAQDVKGTGLQRSTGCPTGVASMGARSPKGTGARTRSGRPSFREQKVSIELSKIAEASGGDSMLLTQACVELYKVDSSAQDVMTANGTRKAKDFVRLFPQHYDLAVLDQHPPRIKTVSRHLSPGCGLPDSGASPSKAEQWAAIELGKIVEASGGDSMLLAQASSDLYKAQSSARNVITANGTRKAKDFVRLFPQHYELAALEQHPSWITIRGRGGDAADKRLSSVIYDIVRSHQGEMPLSEAERLLYVSEKDAITMLSGRTVAQLVARFPDDYEIAALRESKVRIKASRPQQDQWSPLEVKVPPAVVTYISRLPQAKAGFERQLADKAKDMGQAAPADVSYSGTIISIRAHPSTHTALETCAKAFIEQLSYERRVLLGVDRAAFGDAKVRLHGLRACGVGYHLPRGTIFVFQPHKGLLHPAHTIDTLKHLLEDVLKIPFAVRKILDAPGFYEAELLQGASPTAQQAVRAAMVTWAQESSPLVAPSRAAWNVIKETPQLVSFVWPRDDAEATRCMNRVRADLLKDTKILHAIAIPEAARGLLQQSHNALAGRLLEDFGVTLKLEDDTKIAVVCGSMLHAQLHAQKAVEQVQAFMRSLIIDTSVRFKRVSKPLARWLQRFLHQEGAPQPNSNAADGQSSRDSAEDAFCVTGSMPGVHYCVREDTVVISCLPEHKDEADNFKLRFDRILKEFNVGHCELLTAKPTENEIQRALAGIDVLWEISGASDSKIATASRGVRQRLLTARGTTASTPTTAGARKISRAPSATLSGRSLRIFGPEESCTQAIDVVKELLAGHVSIVKMVPAPDNDPVTALSLRLQLVGPVGERRAGLAALRKHVVQQLAQDATALRLDVVTSISSSDARAVLRVTAPSAAANEAVDAINASLARMASSLRRAVIPASATLQKHFLNASSDAITTANSDGVVVLAAAQAAQMASAETPAILRVRLSTGLLVTVRCCKFQSAGTDGVVNAANKQLKHQGGIAKAIAEMAGASFVQQCEASVKTKGPMATGTARATTGSGKLLALHGISHVIHAVAPVYDHATQGHVMQDANRQLLQEAACAALAEAERCGVMRLYMPCLGSGIFEWPTNVAAEEIVNAILRFAAMRASGDGSLQEIVLGDADTKKAEAFRACLQSVIDSASSTAAAATVANTPRAVAGSRPVEPQRPSNTWYREVKSNERTKHRSGLYWKDWIPYDYDQVMQLETAVAMGTPEVTILGDRLGMQSDSKHIPAGYKLHVPSLHCKSL